MDEDSDVDRELDNSLVDLHHGLDSSAEENRAEDINDGGVDGNDKDVYVGSDSTQPMNLPAQHVNMLEDMVQEMRQGLQAAVEELAKLQGREEGERDRQLQQQQQRQLDDLTENVSDLKNQMNSVTKCLETIQRESTKLREDYTALTKYVKESKGDGMTQLSDHSFEWNEKIPDNPFESGNEVEEMRTYRDTSNKDNDEVTAVACKSLSLTQALHLNLSLTSDDEEEEGDEPEVRRLSHIAPSANTHRGEDTNRRHSLPASGTPRGNNNSDHVINAGQRRKAVKELTDSECDYCSQLWTLIETYCASLQNAGFLSHDQLEVLFPSYLEKLYEQHCVIYSNLQDKLVHWSYLTVVSDLLSCITDTHNPYSLLSMYREYSENLPDAVACLRNALTHSTELKALLKTIQQSSYQNDDLMTLIKAPAQHLPKYLLQLQQICKYTPSTHPDYLLLRTSLSRLRLFVEQMNIGINNAIQTTSQDFRQGSSNDSSQVLSARDSGNISNEDELLSARTLFKSEQCLLSEDTPDDPYHFNMHGQQTTPGSSLYGRHSRGVPRPRSSNMNTLSHPDLSRISHSPVPNANSAPFSLPPTGLAPHQGWRNGMEGRQATKTKLQMKRSLPAQQPPFLHPDTSHHLSSSRPSSAIDFTNGYNNINNANNTNGYPVHHYPGTNHPRPRSALGPLDSHHRPTIISRKHMRRSQPPVSNSGYWGDVEAQQHSKHHSQQKMSFSPHELLPSRPSPLLPYNSHEDDEEDDTRASDSFSCVTSSSHQHSSGRGSNNGHDIDIDFQPLASDPSPFGRNGNNNKQFSEDDVAARLAQELLSDNDDDDQKEFDNMNVYNGERNERTSLQAVEYKGFRQMKGSESKAKTVNGNERKNIVPKQQALHSRFHKRDDRTNESPSSNESRGFESYTSNDEHSTTNNDVQHSPTQQDPHAQDPKVSRQNGEHKEHQNDVEDKRQKNQSFLLSLTHSPRSKKSIETTFHTRDSHPHSLQYSGSRSPVPILVSDEKQDASNDKPSFSQTSQTSHSKMVRRSAPSLIPPHTLKESSAQPREHESARISSPTPFSSFNGTTYKTDIDNSVTSAVSLRSYSKTPPPPPPSSVSLAGASSETKPSGVTSRHKRDDDDSKNLMTRSLDLSEVLDSDDTKKSSYDRRKKMKNGEVDTLLRASDDPVNARKKMHLKSSLKNLFTKKRGKVILADVEREVILEMASAVVSASTSSSPPPKSIQCSPVDDSIQTGSEKHENSIISCSHDKQLANSMTPKEVNGPDKHAKIPAAFEIKCKKDKGSSTSSPLKVGRPCSYIQPSDNPTKSFPRLSLNTDSLPQSPCIYQEKLLKERLNIQGNPDPDQKSLIHPKFLLSCKVSKGDEKVTLRSSASLNTNSVTVIPCNNSQNVTSPSQDESKEKCDLQDDKGKKGKDNDVCKSISKYEESEKKQIKAKMKAYAHMKKHILNYESHEAGVKDRDEAMKKFQEKNNSKPMKPKVECPKCQNKSISGWKHLEQTPGKSFHIQAYKAYKNKNRENINVDKQEMDDSQRKEHQHFQQQTMIKSDTSQSPIHFLKPCEKVLAYYETSRNPKMTSSYPMASQERKLKKRNFPLKEQNILAHKPNIQIVDAHSKSNNASGMSLRENVLLLSSGVFYDGERHELETDLVKSGNGIFTNDLSHPTNTTVFSNALNAPKLQCFNVPASAATSNIQTIPYSNQNKRHSSDAGSCVNNILRMSKEDLFEYERNRPLQKDSKGKSDMKKIITRPNIGSGSIEDNAAKVSNGGDRKGVNHEMVKEDIVTGMKKEGKELENYHTVPKEEKDYFDYTYRLCYVDCSKYDGDLSSCANCSVDENSPEKEIVTGNKSLSGSLKTRETPIDKAPVDAVSIPKRNRQDTSSINVDKALQIETRACSELNKWLSNLNNSPSFYNKDMVSPVSQQKEKVPASNNYVPQEKGCTAQKLESALSVSSTTHGQVPSCTHNATGSGYKMSSTSNASKVTQNFPNKCVMHYPEFSHQPTPMNKYNCRNSTLETFSPSMTQPIFSVLPIEGYHIENNHLPLKTGSYACQKPHENPSSNLANLHSSKSQDDAVARRALKQRIKSKEAARLSTCSVQSANEIHILKLHNFGDIQCSVESERQLKHNKEASSHHKNGDPGTLQVRYIPKPFGVSKQNKIQTTAHAQIKRDSGCINGMATNTSNPLNALRCSPSTSQLPQSAYDHHQQHHHGMSASGVTGPDLLQVSVIPPEASNKSDPSDNQGSSTPPKKQSFFSRFAHSPLSIFYKDAKTSGSK